MEPQPASVIENQRLREAVDSGVGAYTGRRLRSQRDIVRDVLLAASGYDAWVTLEELRILTKFNAASISAQMRHLRKPEYGGFRINKRVREHQGRANLWEYRIFVHAGLRDGQE